VSLFIIIYYTGKKQFCRSCQFVIFLILHLLLSSCPVHTLTWGISFMFKDAAQPVELL